MGTITVVGLGPGRSDLIVPAAITALRRCETRFVRTARHPAVDDLIADGFAFKTFDEIYERESDLERVYESIVAAVIAAAIDRDVVYAVPGNPVVAERTVLLLRARVPEVRIVPGLSFADLAWAHVGVDPLSGARIIDARAFEVESAGKSGPLLIAQADSKFVLSDIKIALLEELEAEHEIVVLQRLGLEDENVQRLALVDLDRDIEPDHLTSVFVDTGSIEIASEFSRLWQLTLRLRGPGGCPWDAEQTHHSLARHTLEEAYEVVEAIDRLSTDAPGGDCDADAGYYEKLEDELGDLLFQVMIHSALALEAGAFTAADVASTVHAKLVHRHPHVFGDTVVDSADDVVSNWETIKKAEQGSSSLVDGLPAALPALLYTPKLYRKMKVVGLDPASDQPRAWLDAAAVRLHHATRETMHDAIGESLAALVAVARSGDVDPESALRGFVARMRDDFQVLETRAASDGSVLEAMDRSIVRQWWREARPNADAGSQ